LQLGLRRSRVRAVLTQKIPFSAFSSTLFSFFLTCSQPKVRAFREMPEPRLSCLLKSECRLGTRIPIPLKRERFFSSVTVAGFQADQVFASKSNAASICLLQGVRSTAINVSPCDTLGDTRFSYARLFDQIAIPTSDFKVQPRSCQCRSCAPTQNPFVTPSGIIG